MVVLGWGHGTRNPYSVRLEGCCGRHESSGSGCKASAAGIAGYGYGYTLYRDHHHE